MRSSGIEYRARKKKHHHEEEENAKHLANSLYLDYITLLKQDILGDCVRVEWVKTCLPIDKI